MALESAFKADPSSDWVHAELEGTHHRQSGREIRVCLLEFLLPALSDGIRRLGLESLTMFSCVTLGKSLPFPMSPIFITRKKMGLPIHSLVLARAVIEIR